MDDGVIIFIPYGSRLGFHVGGPASTMANIDYKFPQCVCYEVPMDERLIVLNDQGGAVMDVSNEVTATLRAQDHGHPPVVCLNFQGSKSNNVCTEDGTCYSMNAMHGHDVHVVCFEPGIMSRDCSAGNRAYENLCSTLRANMGDNQPAVCYAIEGNGSRPSHQGTGYSDEGKMFTLNTIEKHAVCYGISSYFSNAMLSDNPHSGIYEAKTSRCLDLNGGNPACHQGGMIIVYEGQNACTDTNTAFTLQAGRPDDHHISTVCYAIENHPADSRVRIEESDTFQTLSARCGTGGGNTPMVLIEVHDESLPNDNRSFMCEQSSGQLHRTGCIQQYAPGIQEE